MSEFEACNEHSGDQYGVCFPCLVQQLRAEIELLRAELAYIAAAHAAGRE